MPSSKFIFTPSFSSFEARRVRTRSRVAGADAVDEAGALFHGAVEVAAVVVEGRRILFHAGDDLGEGRP